MISEYKKGQPKNPNFINDLVNDDVLDSSLDNLGICPDDQISYNFDEIEDQEINIINDQNLKNECPLKLNNQKYQNQNKINDMESNWSTYQGIYDEQEEKQQNSETEQFWTIKKTKQDNYRVFQKKSKKKTKYFD
ncbi:unnamed protein product [Paramecium primaurelia]|uniref:Uncharacterized protein n=1 Tax=Paramecium primaurelia TaxID=5886 RepID=A0A8S1PCF6_PARPR|nr:unnamed protein product [Paramecium primaurelia]